MRVIRLTASNWELYKADIKAIETTTEYSFGNDFFKIDHGENYFAFFERLGDAYFYGWLQDQKVVAVAAGVLRNININGSKQRAWYLCDLKVHPAYRCQHISLRLIARALPFNYLRCQRGYAISMDRSFESSNRTVKLLGRLPWIRFNSKAKLLFWSLDFNEMTFALPTLALHRGAISFLSLRGIKDIVLKSTGKPMPLLHAQFGPLGSGKILLPEKDAIHMFSAPENNSLAIDIQKKGLKPSATATVISHRMTNDDWSWVLTSDV